MNKASYILIFMRGTDVLSEELKVLNERKDEIPFIVGLRELELKLDFFEHSLNQLRIATNIKTAVVDKYAFQGVKIKPKRKQIVIIGMIASLILGIFVSFFLNSVALENKKLNI